MNAAYWERRYLGGGTSGAGSRGHEAQQKATLLQSVIDRHGVHRMLDLGCGDGYVAQMLRVDFYVGFDPAPAGLALCREAMPGARFVDQVPPGESFDLVASLDVLHHLVDSDEYRAHLALLFGGFADLVFVYGTDRDERGAPHVLHRHWTADVPLGWDCVERASASKTSWVFRRC